MQDGLSAGISVRDLHLEVVQGAQHAVGRMWEENRITVAREHVASAIAQLALAQLYPHLPRGEANGWRAVLACVRGEQHELAARVASDFMEMAGFEVRFMGADVPTDALVDAIDEGRAHVMALSITIDHHWEALLHALQTVATSRPRVLRVVGGRAVRGREDELAALGVLCSADRADTLVQRLVGELAERRAG